MCLNDCREERLKVVQDELGGKLDEATSIIRDKLPFNDTSKLGQGEGREGEEGWREGGVGRDREGRRDIYISILGTKHYCTS